MGHDADAPAHPIATLMQRVGRGWLAEHGKDGPPALFNVYRRTPTSEGSWQLMPAIPQQLWTNAEPRNVLAVYADMVTTTPALQAVVASLDMPRLIGVLFVAGTWLAAKPTFDTTTPAGRTARDAWHRQCSQRGASAMPGRIETVTVSYAGRDNILGSYCFEALTGNVRDLAIDTDPDPGDPDRIGGNVPTALLSIARAYQAASTRHHDPDIVKFVADAAPLSPLQAAALANTRFGGRGGGRG